MNKRNLQALLMLTIAIPSFSLGYWQLGMSSNNTLAIIISIAITLGGAGILSGLIMLFTKNRLGWFDDDLVLKTIFKKEKKEMTKIKKEEPIKKEGSESIGLMQREKELVKRSDELNALVSELDAELNQVRESLEIKGWVLSDNGWVIG